MPFCVTANPGRRLESPPDILSEPQLGRTRPMACDRDRQRKDDAILLVISEGAPHVKTIDSQDSRSPGAPNAHLLHKCGRAAVRAKIASGDFFTPSTHKGRGGYYSVRGAVFSWKGNVGLMRLAVKARPRLTSFRFCNSACGWSPPQTRFARLTLRQGEG